MKSIRHVLCATDLSGASRQAIAAATLLATNAGAKLTIMHVLPPPVVAPYQLLDAKTMARLRQRAHAWGLGRLRQLSMRATRAGVETSLLLRGGDPADEIVRAARAKKVDLVVVGTHGRRGLARLLLGSVAHRVAGLAPCAVLTVPGPARAGQAR